MAAPGFPHWRSLRAVCGVTIPHQIPRDENNEPMRFPELQPHGQSHGKGRRSGSPTSGRQRAQERDLYPEYGRDRAPMKASEHLPGSGACAIHLPQTALAYRAREPITAIAKAASVLSHLSVEEEECD